MQTIKTNTKCTYYSEGQTYFPNISVAYMQLLLLFSVNYPDIQLPAQLTIHITHVIFFYISLLALSF